MLRVRLQVFIFFSHQIAPPDDKYRGTDTTHLASIASFLEACDLEAVWGPYLLRGVYTADLLCRFNVSIDESTVSEYFFENMLELFFAQACDDRASLSSERYCFARTAAAEQRIARLINAVCYPVSMVVTVVTAAERGDVRSGIEQDLGFLPRQSVEQCTTVLDACSVSHL